MNNKQNNAGGKGHDVFSESASSSNSSSKLTQNNNFINITTHNVQGLLTILKQQQLNTFLFRYYGNFRN